MRYGGITICAIVALNAFIVSSTYAQIHVPPEMRGDRKYRRVGLHNGNLVETLFWNFGEVAWWGKQPSGVWPKGTLHSYMDGITPIAAAEVTSTHGKLIHIIEAGYRELMDISPAGVERGWQPRPGYFNPNQDNLAMSDQPITWPDSWPNRPSSWNGKWNGYFGQRTNADQESYFVMDDNSDDGQDYYPDSTDLTRRGLGLRMEVRGLQWSNTLAQDNIFWHYEVTNEAAADYTKVVFGMYCDSGVGGQYDSNDDNASYDKSLNITYTWDTNGLGEGGWGPTGIAGYAFLESPGNPYNGIDDDDDSVDPNSPHLKDTDFLPRAINAGDKFVVIESITYKRTVVIMPDRDTTVVSLGHEYHLHPGIVLQEIPGNNLDDNLNGLIDESLMVHLGLAYRNYITSEGLNDLLIDEQRDSGPGQLVYSWVPDYKSGPDSRGKYRGIYKQHWSGDENGDWDPETDDVGADGVPGTGDIGEGDAKPTPGEPHFDQTDKNESDQIGLTAFDVFYIGSGVAFYDDEGIWQRIANSHFDTRLQNGNIAFLYGSGPFPLPPGKTQRFSLALVFGQNLDDLVRHKVTVEQIYNNNYNFARPPDKPHLRVVAGDRKVTLYWDDVAERSYDPFSSPPYDFEGYKIYKSTDPAFNDPLTITNGFGDKVLFQPVAQFDIRDGVSGFFPIADHGVQFYLGDDKGIKHSWVDTNVVNGQTYYYAVVSYDRGDVARGIFPSECTKVISRDRFGSLAFDINTGKATPNAACAGFRDAHLDGGVIRHVSGFGTGAVWLNFLDPLKVRNRASYRLLFDDTSKVDTLLYSLYEITNPSSPFPVFKNSTYVRGEDSNPLFDGMRLYVQNDSAGWDPVNTKWISGQSNTQFIVSLDEVTRRTYFQHPKPGYPDSYEIRVGIPDTSWLYNSFQQTTNFQVWDVTENHKMRYYLKEPAGKEDGKLSAGDYIDLWYSLGPNVWIRFWRIELIAPAEGSVINPTDGDTAIITIRAPFRSNDIFEFTTVAATIDTVLARESLDRIAVVPNPYTIAAKWEPQRLTQSGRGERLLEFIHLPARCTIQIFTVSGDLVKMLEHDAPMTDGAEFWDLRTKDGMDVAPGIYVYYVDAPGNGTKIGKFAIIK
ncbi:MAG: hypothetical protein ACP5JH_11450 [Bacteroidota bacterium]